MFRKDQRSVLYQSGGSEAQAQGHGPIHFHKRRGRAHVTGATEGAGGEGAIHVVRVVNRRATRPIRVGRMANLTASL
jgi:hypothetical protein